ncbi:MAG: dephospho-CoA kinase [Clostridia bacterium]|nr:dephospho-CoA kinase [Clostridia bacterium]
MLEKANLKVIDTDSLARKAVESRDVIDRLCKAFGDDIIKDGVLERKALARKAFKDEESTKLLNSITHPEITRLTIEAIHLAENEGKKGAVIDAPVLFESPLTAVCNKIICVVAPEEVRLQRIMERDGISREDALIRMGAQKSKEYYVSKSDFVIENNNLNETEKIISEFLKEEML